MSTASEIVAKYGTRNADVIKDFGLKGVWAEAVAKGLLNVAWNWHVYGPKGTNPSEAMTKHTRKQAVESLAIGRHPIIDALAKEIRETP
jgi:hypothetical protein